MRRDYRIENLPPVPYILIKELIKLMTPNRLSHVHSRVVKNEMLRERTTGLNSTKQNHR